MIEENYFEIKLEETELTLAELIDLAKITNVIIKTDSGKEYVLAKIDVFDIELSLIYDGRELYNFVLERTKSKKAVISKS
jgi:hypothetical protein